GRHQPDPGRARHGHIRPGQGAGAVPAPAAQCVPRADLRHDRDSRRPRETDGRPAIGILRRQFAGPQPGAGPLLRREAGKRECSRATACERADHRVAQDPDRDGVGRGSRRSGDRPGGTVGAFGSPAARALTFDPEDPMRPTRAPSTAALFTPLLALVLAAPGSAQTLAITGATVIDGTGKAPVSDGVVVI